MAAKRRLAEAFGKIKAPSYAVSLISLAKVFPIFLSQLEKALANFLSSKDQPMGPKRLAFPPMDGARRKMTHLLCKMYMLESESVEEEPNRKVVVKLTANAKAPSLALSSYISELEKKSNDPNFRKMGMLITELNRTSSPKIDTVDLQGTFLRRFMDKYDIHWMDANTVLVTFDSNSTMLTALNTLLGPFSLKPFTESPKEMIGARKKNFKIDYPNLKESSSSDWEKTTTLFKGLKEEKPKIYNFSSKKEGFFQESEKESHTKKEDQKEDSNSEPNQDSKPQLDDWNQL